MLQRTASGGMPLGGVDIDRELRGNPFDGLSRASFEAG